MKWNVKDNKPIESGMTKEDVVHFVRMNMYKLQNKNRTGDNDDIEESDADTSLEVEDSVDDDVNVLIPAVDADVPSTEEYVNEINDDDYLDDDYMFPSFLYSCYMGRLQVMLISWIFSVKVSIILHIIYHVFVLLN